MFSSSTNRILVTGGKGILATAINEYCQSQGIPCHCPSKDECNILDAKALSKVFQEFKPTVVIHAAGIIDVLKCEANIPDAVSVNIIGTINVVQCCLESRTRLVYISSDSVFAGDRGQYSITDRLDPINVYGKTKAASEYIVSVLPDYQIIRVPFLRKYHTKVFNNQWCSRFLLHQVPEKVVKNALLNREKIVHISTERRRLQDLYHEANREITLFPIPKELEAIIPKDASIINTNTF